MKASVYKPLVSFIYKIVLQVIFIFSFTSLTAQQLKIDSLKRLINSTKEDTAKIMLYRYLGDAYRSEKKMDSSVLAFKQALEINKKYNYSLQIKGWDLAALEYILYEMGNYSESLEYAKQQLLLSEQLNDTSGKGAAHLVFGHDYRELGEYRESLNHYFKAKEFYKLFWVSRNKPEDNTYTILCIAQTYLKMNMPDSALFYTKKGYGLGIAVSDGGLILLAERIFGNIYFAKGDDEKALHYYRQYVPDYIKYKEHNRDLGFVLNNMAMIFQKRGEMDSAIFYAKKALSNAQTFQDEQNIYNAANILYELNGSLNNESQALAYFKIAIAAKDSMASIEKIRQIQSLEFAEQTREKEQAEADAKALTRTRLIITIAAILVSIITFLIWNRLRQLRLRYKSILERKEVEKLKTKHEKELLELEAKALRAQMNPHFIFNCMNSIKLLIQQQEDDKAVNYLTTFSKLIRTIFQNSDKREITLYDEIETCKLYTQLESMRFANKFSYKFSIDETVDLKLLMVPALIIQPFIENAIWHGIMPKETGGSVNIAVKRIDENVLCIIDDDGIGRETSKQNKFMGGSLDHESKGVHLTQSRIDLDNLLNQRSVTLETIDKKDEINKPAGTTIVLTFKEY